jgi:hypothetical protein
MKKIFFLAGFAIICMLAVSCKKDTVAVPSSKTEIPDELVGKWQIGNFNIRNFNSYTGTRPANVTTTLAYSISKDGSAEQYLYYDYNDGSDLQTCTYRKGSITFDPASKTWKFCPATGSFRKFQNGKKTQGDITSEGLYPKYAPSYNNYYLEKNNQTTYMECTNEYNEDLSFEKVTW